MELEISGSANLHFIIRSQFPIIDVFVEKEELFQDLLAQVVEQFSR